MLTKNDKIKVIEVVLYDIDTSLMNITDNYYYNEWLEPDTNISSLSEDYLDNIIKDMIDNEDISEKDIRYILSK